MQRFTNILLMAGGDNWQETALQRAISLARENQAELTVIDVVELPGDLKLFGRDRLAKISSQLVEKRREELESSVRHFRTAVAMRTKVVHGTPFLAIIREVLRNGFDLVMKMSAGTGRFQKLLFGSLDMHLLRKCPCPVWIMKQGEVGQYHRVLATMDIEPESGNRQITALNKQILEMASSLALSEFAELHVIHAWVGNGKTILDGIGFGDENIGEQGWAQRSRQLHKQWFDERRQQLLGILGEETMRYLEPQMHLIEGEACEVITDFVVRKKVDVVVMGTVARTGISGFFMGNTAESILNTIDCSVLAVKPPGFITPVTLADAVEA